MIICSICVRSEGYLQKIKQKWTPFQQRFWARQKSILVPGLLRTNFFTKSEICVFFTKTQKFLKAICEEEMFFIFCKIVGFTLQNPSSKRFFASSCKYTPHMGHPSRFFLWTKCQIRVVLRCGIRFYKYINFCVLLNCT